MPSISCIGTAAICARYRSLSADDAARLLEWSDMPCLRLVEAFAAGEQLLEV